MKHVLLVMLFYTSLVACNDNSSKPKEILYDTTSYSDVSRAERNRQIEKAANNRKLLPGKWKLIELVNGDDMSEKLPLKSADFEEIELTPKDSFTIFNKRKIIDAGAFEWTTDDREILLYSGNDSTIKRVLLKNMNDQYLKFRYMGFYFTLQKVK